MRSDCVDETDNIYGRLVVVRQAPTNRHGAQWECWCECGNDVTVSGGNLRMGHVKSCGCWKVDQGRTLGKKYGGLSTKLSERKIKNRLTKSRCCSRCGRRRKPDQFAIDPRSKIPMGLCRRCRNDDRRKYLFGISRPEYERLVVIQNNKCAICFRKPTRKRSLHVDHCHRTGRIRGLLCTHCNAMLGMAKDSTLTLKTAIHYLSSQQ